MLKYVWEGGEGVQGLYDAHLVALYKKGDWGETRAWRPISMTNALYRVPARCLMPVVEELVEKAVGPHQFGAQKKKSCGQATFTLMDEIDRTKKEYGGGYAVFF